MPTSAIIAVCPRCQETRYRSIKQLEPGKDRLVAADFEPVGDQTPAVDTEPVSCYRCGSTLRFAPEKVPQVDAKAVAQMSPRRRVGVIPPPGDNGQQPGIIALFEVQQGEAITEVKKFSDEVYLVITDHRIILVDITPLLEERGARGSR